MEKSPDELGKIVMVGCLETGYDVVKTVLESGINISYIVTITKNKAEEQKVSGYESFEDLAHKHGVPVYFAEKYSLKSQKDISFFQKNKFDLLIQGGWQRLFPEEVLSTLRVGAIGIHGSAEYLPKGRGRSPINWSIIEGRKRFIFHYFLIKPGIDDGDVFHFESVDINQWDTCRTMYYKNSIITKRVFIEWIPKLLGGQYKSHPQIGEPSYYSKRTEEDGLVDWNSGLFNIYNFIRAITHPYPGAFSFIDGNKVRIFDAKPFDTRISYYGRKIGEIVEIFKTGDIVVFCGDGTILLTNIECPVTLSVGQIFSET